MKYLLLYNPVSGKGKFKKKISFIKKEFKKRDLTLDIYESRSAKDLINKSKIEASNYYCYIISGGDGTVNEVVNGIMDQDIKPILAIIPSGTANDTAAILGMKKNVRRSLKKIFDNKPIKMDINQINNQYFIYTTAAGILTKISYDIDREDVRKFGYFAYLREGMRDLSKDYQMKMEIEHDNGIIKGEYMLLLGLAAKRVGGFNLWRFSKARLNDGILDIRLMSYNKRSKLFRLLSFFLLSGKKYRTDVHLQSSKFKITTSNNVIWNIDGEKGDVGSAEINVLKEQIKVIASKRAKRLYFTKK